MLNSKTSDDKNIDNDDSIVCHPQDANLVTSKVYALGRQKHIFQWDLDLPHFYVPSGTMDHAHLYVDVELNEEDYFELLTLMQKLGMVQEGWVASAKRNGYTALRLPGKHKATKHDLGLKSQIKKEDK